MAAFNYYITPEEYAIAERNGIGKDTLESRVRKLGWDKEKAITKKVEKRNKYGEWIEVSRRNGINDATFRYRVRKGWTLEKAATEPVMTKEEIRRRAHEKWRRYPKEVLKLAESNGIYYRTFAYRVKRLGWTMSKAATVPVMKSKTFSEEC
ncbi:hypothetical protein [Clostridium baratii]|uniref:hypothetical protein n=1 Tax=Clostridium baratii TaxID=1561 RepID=UPI0030D1E422